MNMKIISSGLLALLIILGSFGAVGTNTTLKNENIVNNNLDYVPGEVIVCFYTQLDDLDPIDVNEIETFEGKNIKEKIIEMNIAVAIVNEGEELDFINSISDSPFVAYAELNIIFHAAFTPNDPEWSAQWGPKKINCEEAWDAEQGKSSVRIAIVDTGIDYNHVDLSPNYVTGGYDHINSDNDPMDDQGHGTHCAGIAAARINNGKGIAGVAGKCSLISEKVLDSTGYGTSTTVANGINHAVGQGADVISMSLSADSPSSTIENACNNAYNAGVLLVAASGNDGSSVDWPAAFSNVIAVGATDQSNDRCSFSNFGSELELVAPGKDIWSTELDGEYCYKSGTSMATPHVAGVAALVFSKNPGISNSDVRQTLRDTAIDLGATGKDDYYGYGLVDAEDAVGTEIIEKYCYGQDHYDKEGDVEDYDASGEPTGSIYAIRMSEWSDDATAWYDFNLGVNEIEEGSLEVGLEFLDWGALGNGPKLYIYNFEDDKYDILADGMGNQEHLEWKWRTTSNSNDYVDSDGTVDIKIRAEWWADTVLDEICIKYKLTSPPEPDLAAWVKNPLKWTGVEPNAKETGTIYLENIGESGSKLDWKVSESLNWVSCSLTSGTDLLPGNKIEIEVTVTASGQGNDPRSGTITVVNSDNSGDKETFDVSITTKKSRPRAMFFEFLERFPILKELFSTFFLNLAYK